MTSAETLTGLYESGYKHVLVAIKELTAEQLAWQPGSGANSMGFIVWHLARAWDGYFAMLQGGPELYSSPDWQNRFSFDVRGRGVGGTEMGTGFTREDAALVRPEPSVLIAYLETLWDRTRAFLARASESDLAQPILVPWWGSDPVTAERVLRHIITHNLIHAGEAQYVRGLLTGVQPQD